MTTSEGVEFGVEYVWQTGERHVTAFGSEKAARAYVADHSGQSWHPRPHRVMRRTVTDWQPADGEDEAAVAS